MLKRYAQLLSSGTFLGHEVISGYRNNYSLNHRSGD